MHFTYPDSDIMPQSVSITADGEKQGGKQGAMRFYIDR